MWNISVRVIPLVQPPNGMPITIRSSKHDQHVNRRSTDENGSLITTSSRICFHDTFRSVPFITRLPEVIFQNVKTSMQHSCQACQTTSGVNSEQLL
ncbi:hypothetical protein TNCV_1476831 [Trichonephila clavipes]|nr:hypothetical protein TNCV_1476831 [Trichonephila clavipes]